jgi:hypothetical protein
MTKEEFGLNLFECIKTISGLHTLRQQLNVAVHQEDKPAQFQLAAPITRSSGRSHRSSGLGWRYSTIP